MTQRVTWLSAITRSRPLSTFERVTPSLQQFGLTWAMIIGAHAALRWRHRCATEGCCPATRLTLLFAHVRAGLDGADRGLTADSELEDQPEGSGSTAGGCGV